MVVIRLTRKGRTHRPVYTIVAADQRNKRDGRFLDKLGHYNPMGKDGENLSDVQADKIKAWLDKGATLSATVSTLLKKNKIQL